MKTKDASRYHVRTLTSSDFSALQKLEAEIFGADGEDVLCPYYLRLCTEFFSETCFVALADGRPVGYLLCFVRGREAYCTTLGVLPEFQRTRVTLLLLAGFLRAVLRDVETCWFTVKPDNDAARALHAVLGATEAGVVHDFYGPGDSRIVSKIERGALELRRARYERLGLLPKVAPVSSAAASVVATGTIDAFDDDDSTDKPSNDNDDDIVTSVSPALAADVLRRGIHLNSARVLPMGGAA